MQITSPAFKANATAALADAQLQKALGNVRSGFIDKRQKAVDGLPEFERLRDQARDIKNHTLEYLDLYRRGLRGEGGRVGRRGALGRDRRGRAQHHPGISAVKADARTVTKGKSMITEEIGLNDFLEKNHIRPVETDLGEYIIQAATASIRATSSRRRCTSTRTRSRPTSAACTSTCRITAT